VSDFAQIVARSEQSVLRGDPRGREADPLAAPTITHRLEGGSLIEVHRYVEDRA